MYVLYIGRKSPEKMFKDIGNINSYFLHNSITIYNEKQILYMGFSEKLFLIFQKFNKFRSNMLGTTGPTLIWNYVCNQKTNLLEHFPL